MPERRSIVARFMRHKTPFALSLSKACPFLWTRAQRKVSASICLTKLTVIRVSNLEQTSL
jgi:hypothetical protein